MASRAKETRKNYGKMNPIHAAQIQVLHQEGKVSWQRATEEITTIFMFIDIALGQEANQ